MSETKVYYTPYFSSDPIPGGHAIVSAGDFDRVTAERDALQQRLNATDEAKEKFSTAYVTAGEREQTLRLRVYVLEGLLRRWANLLGVSAPVLRDETMTALKQVEVARCCMVSPEDQALLDSGDYTPEELFGVGGKPSCPKCAKPAEGSTCNQIREESGQPINSPCKACGGGACIDR